MSQRYRTRSSSILGVKDGYIAYCFDEACDYILDRLREGKRPFFNNVKDKSGEISGNAATVETLKNLGAEVKQV